MCGRFVLDRKTSDLVSLFDVDVTGAGLPEPSWNIAPTQSIAVVIDSLSKPTEEEAALGDFTPEPVRRLESARWGLVPGFAKDPKTGPPLFNARSEDVAGKASFQVAVQKRRAVIPASGYYEWRVVDGVKTPLYVSFPGEELVLFAGLYDWWRGTAGTVAHAPGGSPWLLSATILTRIADGTLADIHDRMPVFLDADLVEEWLDPQSEGSQELVDEVVAASLEVAERLVFHEVGPEVGSVQNNSRDLTAPVS